ncbi:MAG TPA: hypothetical protein VEO20_03455 [Thermoplasmata archaeon]|nr:hypothetical protein [Thermoplasmata archaeon]
MVDVDPGLVAVLVVAVFFLGWYYAAYIFSRRLAGRVAKELKEAVLALGGKARIQWFGTTAFRMTTEGADPPFREFSVTVTLRPREMPINWALGTAQGRRDAALVEASLRKTPRTGFELVDPETRIGRRRERAKTGWVRISFAGREYAVDAEDYAEAQRTLGALGAEAITPIMALHVTAGSEPGIAASISVEPGHAARGLATIRTLAERLVG